MKQTADRYFRNNESKAQMPEDPLGNNRLTAGETPKSGKEDNKTNLGAEKEGKRDHLTATYWG